MLKLLNTSIDLLRTKHKNGKNYYWLLYYSFPTCQPKKENFHIPAMMVYAF